MTDFSCGSRHSGAVTEDGTLYTWGSNTDAQLGRHTPDQQEAAPGKVDMPGGGKVLNIDFGFEHSAAITEDGLYMWGKDFFMGTPSGQNRPVKIDISNSIAVSLYPDGMNNGVVTSDGFLYTWGSNDYGELGDGTTNDRFVPEKVATLSHIQSACMGQETSGAVTRDGSVYVWGTNAFGLRGDGSSSLNDRITEPYQLSFAGNDTAVFHHLTPDETYEFYMVKDKTKSDLLSPDNLLYTTQGIADSSGTLEISYLTLNDYSHVEIFVKGADKKEISLAQAEASDMELLRAGGGSVYRMDLRYWRLQGKTSCYLQDSARQEAGGKYYAKSGRWFCGSRQRITVNRTGLSKGCPKSCFVLELGKSGHCCCKWTRYRNP